jgi:hypothetical protein
MNTAAADLPGPAAFMGPPDKPGDDEEGRNFKNPRAPTRPARRIEKRKN